MALLDLPETDDREARHALFRTEQNLVALLDALEQLGVGRLEHHCHGRHAQIVKRIVFDRCKPVTQLLSAAVV